MIFFSWLQCFVSISPVSPGDPYVVGTKPVSPMRYEKWAMESLKRGRVPTEMDASFWTVKFGDFCGEGCFHLRRERNRCLPSLRV